MHFMIVNSLVIIPNYTLNDVALDAKYLLFTYFFLCRRDNKHFGASFRKSSTSLIDFDEYLNYTLSQNFK